MARKFKIKFLFDSNILQIAGKFKIKSIQYLLDSNALRIALPNQSKIQLKMMPPYLQTRWLTHFTRRLLAHPLIKKENDAMVDDSMDLDNDIAGITAKN